MKYDFDTIIERRGTDSLKWSGNSKELPMWVADMDFRTAPEITEALSKRLNHGIFGYSEIPDEWYEAYLDWWRGRHNLEMERQNLVFASGVIPSISSMIRNLTEPGESVLVQSPVYNHFYNIIRDNGRSVSESPLLYENGEYYMDFDDLEIKMSAPGTKLMILCNPHNPIGKIWDKESLARVGELANKHRVTVVSDEIHCDITKPGKEYTPYVTASDYCKERGITCIAPTKAFNLAGLHTSAVYMSDTSLKNKIQRGFNTDEVAEPNSFATITAIAAFNNGAQWLDEMRNYVFENRKLAEEFIEAELPEIKVVKGDATYLVWIDISSLHDTGRNVSAQLRKNAGLFVSRGDIYGTGGEYFLRMNLACPRSLCIEGLNRLKKGIENDLS